MSESEGTRLQKVLAAAGVGSRRYCEILIERGRVKVNGEVVRTQGVRINPAVDVVHVDGDRIPTAPDTEVYVLNKPRGMHTTMSDPQGRPCVGDLVSDMHVRLFHVGRLDADTEGLILLTNDGELANRLTHPSHGVPKTYLARIEGLPSKSVMAQIRSGVVIEDRPVDVDSINLVQRDGGQALVELTIHEGRNRIVRRLFEEVGHPVVGLVRTRMGPVGISGLKPGRLRKLNADQLRLLYTAAGM